MNHYKVSGDNLNYVVDVLRENPQGLNLVELIKEVRLKHGDVENFRIFHAQKAIEVAHKSGLIELSSGIQKTRYHIEEDIYFLSDNKDNQKTSA